MSSSSPDEQYLLGHGEREWDRLAKQHLVWRDTLLGTLDRLDLATPGTSILEVGCGNGALLADLADRVGDGGRAVGVEKDPEAVARARQHADERVWTTVHEGDIYRLDEALEAEAQFDLVVARWVISFLAQPEQAIAQLTRRLRPGGHLLIQDYAYDMIEMAPDLQAINHLFQVMPEVYAHMGGDARIAFRLPAIFVEQGLELIAIQPHVKAGGGDSPVFRWAQRFFTEHMPSIVDTGALSQAEGTAALNEWARAADTPGCVFFSPAVVDVVGCRGA